MPSKGSKRCGYILPGGRGRCKKLVPDGKHIYCEYHQAIDLQRFRERSDRAPGKMYSTAKWKRLRGAHLAMQPLCEVCGKAGQVVDHIEPHRGAADLFFDSENLMTLCKPHHDAITQIEIKLRGKGANGKQIAQYKKQWVESNGNSRQSASFGSRAKAGRS